AHWCTIHVPWVVPPVMGGTVYHNRDTLMHTPRSGCHTATREGGGTVRSPVGLGRWRGHGDRLPAPRVPARRLRPLPAARGPTPRPRQGSRPPLGAPGGARGGAPGTRRAGTPSRPRPRESLGGSRPPQVCHSRPCANARGARAHQSGEFLPL